MDKWSAMRRIQPLRGERDPMGWRRLCSVGTAAIGVMSLSSVASTGAAEAASAANPSNATITGYQIVEARIALPPHSFIEIHPECPVGDVVVGGGGYEVTQKVGEDINSSYPDSAGTGWIIDFSNNKSLSNTEVGVAVCAASSSIENYSVQYGELLPVPAHGEGTADVACPSGTVALGGGADVQGNEQYWAMSGSAPNGSAGWQVITAAAGPEPDVARATVLCATAPAGWAQASSTTKHNPAGKATNVTARCPTGTNVLGGGPVPSSTDPHVTIGLTTSLTPLTGWHSKENNASATGDSVVEWAVCANTVAASS